VQSISEYKRRAPEGVACLALLAAQVAAPDVLGA